MKRSIDLPKMPTEVVLEAAKLTDPEARFLVANYYLSQDMRKRTDMQIRHLGDKEMPAVLKYASDNAAYTEEQVKKALAVYANSTLVGRWCMAQYGIGPVITAGLMAHLAVERPVLDEKFQPVFDDNGEPKTIITETVGHWWRFAGLDPTDKWNKKEKRPWNAALKQICWHAGQCFKRVSGNDEAFYGQLYAAKKALVVAHNDAGGNAERAKTFVTTSAEVRKTLAKGKLPDGNLDSQACRYAVKIFLSHLHAVWFWDHFGKPPAKPFGITHLGHAHEIRVPNSEMFPGFDKAYYGTGGQARGRKAA